MSGFFYKFMTIKLLKNETNLPTYSFPIYSM